MATTKSTRKTPVKSKTTSKAVKKPVITTKTSAARVSAGTKSEKPVITTRIKNQSSKATVKRVFLSPLDRLRNLNITNAILYSGFAVLVAVFAKTAGADVTAGIQARDQFASDSNVVLGPASEILFNIGPKHILEASLVVSALGALLLASRWRNKYEASLVGANSGYRWVLIGLSGALLMTFVNMISGVQDLAAIKMSAGLILVTALLSWLAEKENVGAVLPRWHAYLLSLFTGALAWLPVAVALIGTTLFADERFGWHVYAIAGVTLAGFTAYALKLYEQIKKPAAGEYASQESGYWRIDMIQKVLIVLIVLTALQ